MTVLILQILKYPNDCLTLMINLIEKSKNKDNLTQMMQNQVNYPRIKQIIYIIYLAHKLRENHLDPNINTLKKAYTQ